MFGKTIGGILLVAGTTIGAAMLGLPTVTGLAGFMPTMGFFFLYWLTLLASALLLLEVNLWFPEEANLVTMAKKTLGKFGEAISWSTYLFLLYALNTAYLSGSSKMVHALCLEFFGICLPFWVSPIPIVIIFGFFVYQGARYVDRVNRWMIAGLFLSYIGLMALLAPYVEWENLTYQAPSYLLIASPVIATSFGFHIIIPTLCTYLERDLKALRTAIFFGSLLPFIVYIAWEMVILGIIPVYGDNGLSFGYKNDLDAMQLLPSYLNTGVVSFLAWFFSFFAILTSFLGVSLSLRDFLADGLGVRKNRFGRFGLDALTFLPTLVIMWTHPNVFLGALELAGAYGVMILLVLLPAMMVWRGRYVLGFFGEYRVKGGKSLLVLVSLVALATIAIKVLISVGFLHQLVAV